MAEVVLDSSAIIAMLSGEPGGELVRSNLPGAIISTVNLTEVGTRLSDRGADEATIRHGIQMLDLEIATFDAEQALGAALLRPSTRQFGLSLGDRACLALAARRRLPVLTADRNWARLSIGIDIRLIRGHQ